MKRFLYIIALGMLVWANAWAVPGNPVLQEIQNLKAAGMTVPPQLYDKLDPVTPELFPTANSSRQGGNDCNSARSFVSLPYTDTGVINADTMASWYSFTPTENMGINVTLCDSDFDTKLTVYLAGDCTAFTDSLYNDDYCGLQSGIESISLTAGNTYYIKVWPYGSASGNYTLNVTECVYGPEITLVSSPSSHVYSDDADTVVVNVVDTNPESRSISEVNLFYRYSESSAYVSVPMDPTGNPDEYFGLIPASGTAPVYPAQDTTFYYIQALDDESNETLLPTSGAYSFYILPEPPTSGGPDAVGYTWINSDDAAGPEYSWTTLTDPTVIEGLADDNVVGPFPIGFSFPFYFAEYDSFYVGSNGILGFSSDGMSSWSNQNIPYTYTPNNLIAWFWDDLNPTTGGTAEYGLEDGNLVVTMTGYHEYGGSGSLTAQVILTPDGEIIVNYQSFDNGIDINGCTLGIENADGTEGLMPLYNGTGITLHNELAVCYAEATIPSPEPPTLDITYDGAQIILTVSDEYGWEAYDIYESTLPYSGFTFLATIYPLDPTYTLVPGSEPMFYQVVGRTGELTSAPGGVILKKNTLKK